MFKPTTFGKFFLYEKLAIGGMAEIFKAKLYGIAGFEKTLVVKQILPEYAADAEFVKMFIDEANIAVSLTHGNIVPVYELGKIGDRYYIAMEYVDGENMETVVDQCRRLKREVPVHLGVEIAIEICKGLDYAHKKLGSDNQPLKIVHRDVSPQNIMVSFDGEVKLVDFGIAKAASKLSLTRVGTLKGKFGYMSPEQATGTDVDGRTDIFAVGIVLWELITSTRLFDAENDLDLLKRVRAGAVMPPRMVAPRVPEPLERIVMRALTKDLDVRYQQAGQFQLDLQRWLYSRQPDPNEEQLSSFMRALFRRDANPRATPPPVPSMEKMQIAASQQEPRRQRDLSYAQSDEIARALEEAANEARRVIVEARPGDEASFERSYDEDRETNDQSAIPRQPDLDHNTAQGIGALVPEDSGEATSTHTSSDSGEGVMVESTAAYVEATNTSSETADLDGQLDGDVIEWDETTDKKIIERIAKTPGDFVERTTIEGPVIRVPRKPGAVGGIAPWDSDKKSNSNSKEVAPPWSVAVSAGGAIPAPPDDGKTTPGDARIPARSMSRRVEAAPHDEPLFAPRKRRGGRAFFALFVLFIIVAGVVLVAQKMGIVDLPLPTPVTTGTAEIETPAPTPFETASVIAAATATATATPIVTATPTPPLTPIPTPTPTAKATATRVAISTPRATPVPVQYGTISVQATPWGEVKIDGVKVKNTPLVKHRLKAGPHTIVVSNPDLKKSETKKITVRANTDEDPIVINFE